MTPAPDYARLRELAERATAEHDARYLADCDPQAILALLDERDALLAQVEQLEAQLEITRAANNALAGERNTVNQYNEELEAVLERVRAVVDGTVRYDAAYDLAADIRAELPEAP